MKRLVFCFVTAALSTSAAALEPAAALDPSAATSAPVAPVKVEKPKKERKICKTPSSSESRLGGTVCRTAAEWAKLDGEVILGGRSHSTRSDD